MMADAKFQDRQSRTEMVVAVNAARGLVSDALTVESMS
jgi:hypothetical protein